MSVAEVTELKAWRTDEDLVLDARAGSREAKAALFRRHARTASDLAYRLLGRDDELEDVVQESFVAVFSGLSKLVEPRAFHGWLASIVTRTAIATIRRRRLLSRLGFVQVERVRVEAILTRDAPPDVLAELEAVYRAVDTLPTAERVVLILRRIEQLALDEIAERTGFSLATVKRRLSSAEVRLNERSARTGQRR